MSSREISEDILQQVYRLRREQAQMLKNSRLLTRSPCGITSPRLSRNKLHSHTLFGRLAKIPFVEVLARTEQNSG